MKSHLNHLQININPSNLGFYKKLMAFLGWKTIHEEKNFAGFTSPMKTKGDLWFVPVTKTYKNNYDASGVNHIAIGVEKKRTTKLCLSLLTRFFLRSYTLDQKK